MKRFKYTGTENELKELGFQKDFSGFYWRKKYGKEIYVDNKTNVFYYWYRQCSFGNYVDYIKSRVSTNWIKDLIKKNLVVEV